jgi:alkylation response protein AidB-like acyl-CoA dehydrogenase
MDLVESPEQLLLQDGARDLLERRCPPERVMALWDQGAFDVELWRQASEIGWAGIMVPEPLGLGLGVGAAAGLVEQAGRVLAPIPLASGIVGAWLAASVGAPASMVENLATGIERPAIIEGKRADLVRDAAVATVFLSVQAGRLRCISASGGGASVTPRLAAGRLREASVDLLASTGEDLGGITPETAAQLTVIRIVLEAAEMVGACEKVLELGVEHVRTRHQFGKALAAFQSVQHRMADMLTDLDSMHWLCRRTAAEFDAGRDASLLAEHLAITTKDSSQRIVASCLQVHGGIGFIRDHPLHLYFGRQKAAALSFGLAGAHRERIAAAILDAAGGGIVR